MWSIFSKCGPWVSNFRTTWKLIRNANSYTPPQTYWIRIAGACSSLRTTDIRHFTNILKCYKTLTMHTLVHAEHHNLRRGKCLIWNQKIRYFSLAFCFSQLMKLPKADFPRGIISFRNIQHPVSEGPGVISSREGKDREFFFTGLYFDKAILLERIDVSTLTLSHNKFVSVYSMNYLS